MKAELRAYLDELRQVTRLEVLAIVALLGAVVALIVVAPGPW